MGNSKALTVLAAVPDPHKALEVGGWCEPPDSSRMCACVISSFRLQGGGGKCLANCLTQLGVFKSGISGI